MFGSRPRATRSGILFYLPFPLVSAPHVSSTAYQSMPSHQERRLGVPIKKQAFSLLRERCPKASKAPILLYYKYIIGYIYWGIFYTFSGYFFHPESIVCDGANDDKQKQHDERRHRAVYSTTKSAIPALTYFLFNSPTPTQIINPNHRLNNTYSIDRWEDSLYRYTFYIAHRTPPL